MKMKQKIAMALCAFYLISMVGLAVSMHFCSGKLSSVRLLQSAKCKSCEKQTSIAKNQDCCKTTAIDVKIKDSHQAGPNVKLPDNFGLQLFLGQDLNLTVKVILSKILRLSENKAPPLSSIISLHLINCVFRN